MELALRFAFGGAVLLVVTGAIVWMLWRLLKNSYDPSALLFRWVITLVVVIGGYFAINHIVGRDGGPLEKIFGLFLGMFLGLILAGLWVPAIVEKVSDAFGGLYTGGSEPAVPQPFYSIAETKRKQGKFKEAIYEIQQQLLKFPTDVTGHVLLASIQADNLNDLPGAELTIERFCHQPGHTPAHLAFGLNALADWHLKLQDTDAARGALEKIIALLPETPQARMAAERIAHCLTQRIESHGRAVLLIDCTSRPLHLLTELAAQAGVDWTQVIVFQASEFVGETADSKSSCQRCRGARPGKGNRAAREHRVQLPARPHPAGCLHSAWPARA